MSQTVNRRRFLGGLAAAGAAPAAAAEPPAPKLSPEVEAQFQAVLARRGITDMRLVMVEPWPAGYYGAEDDPTRRRLSRPIVFVRDSPHDNGHAHPIEGVVVLVDLGTMQVVRVEDYGVVPVPPAPGNYQIYFTTAAGTANQYQASLSNLAPWTIVTPPPTVIGDQNIVTNSLIDGYRFFRLHRP